MRGGLVDMWGMMLPGMVSAERIAELRVGGSDALAPE
jgi:hypothetical protein